MSLSADIDASTLTVLLDVRHPFACLALGPTRALGESLGIDVNWLPIEAQPLNPPSTPAPGDDRGVRHKRYRAQAIAREIDVYAAAQGLVLRDPYRAGDVAAANRGWLWVRDRAPAALPDWLERLFAGYWSVELDASDPRAVAATIDAVGADGAGFLDWCDGDGAAAAERLAAELRERGVFGVPAYLLEDEVFQGRQHLPMIRWILEGRSGPVPI
ncbi:MAG: DsbA family protein [Myxococcota bacterium]